MLHHLLIPKTSLGIPKWSPFIRCSALGLESKFWNGGVSLHSRSAVVHPEQEEEALRRARPFSEIPGYRKYPIIGNMLSILMRKDFDNKRLHLFWKNMFSDFGPMVRLHFPMQPGFLAVYKPEHTQLLFKVTESNPVAHRAPSLKKIRDEAVDNYFEKRGGILAEDNEEWLRVRSRVQTPMMKPQNVVRYLPGVDEISLEFIERIAHFQEKYGEMPENFQFEIYKWALESVGLISLNRRLGCLDPDLPPDSMPIKLINSVSSLFQNLNDVEISFHLWEFFPTPSFRKLAKAHDTFLEIADANIRETEKALKEKIGREGDSDFTLMETLLRTDGLTRKDVVTLILDMIFAGIDTTSHAIAFTLYCLARNPSAQEKLHQEVDSVLGDGKETLTSNHMAKLSFLKGCVRETMRLFPVAIGNARILQKDTVFSDYTVPKGTQIIAFNMMSGWDEEYFPRAKEFLPERWGRDRPLGPINPFASLPFSHGTRMCIGRRIAEQELYCFLARIMHRYKVEYHHEDIGIQIRLVSTPDKPLKFKFIDRRN